MEMWGQKFSALITDYLCVIGAILAGKMAEILGLCDGCGKHDTKHAYAIPAALSDCAEAEAYKRNVLLASDITPHFLLSAF